MKAKQQEEETANPQLYKKVHRLAVAQKTKKCSFCPPHGGENARLGRKIGRNWKKKRKTKYKGDQK